MRRYILGLIYFSLLSSTTRSQSFGEALETYTSSLPENIYLQLDQDYYVPGETIWFKTYLYKDGKPIDYNRNLYIQLLGPEGKAVQNQFYPVIGSVATGSIRLGENLINGTYYIRALTDPIISTGKNIYVRPIQISRTFPVITTDLGMSFYPESGQLISGMLTRVAFQATSGNGAAVPVQGALLDSDGKQVLQFNTYHDGKGVFEFRPQAGLNYRVEFIHDGQLKTFNLPATRQSGINLRIEEERDGKSFLLSRIAVSGENNIVYLVAQLNGHVVYEEEIAFDDYPSVKGHLVTKDLPSGVLQFTVFNKNREVVAERLSFVQNGEYLSAVSFDLDKISSKPRSLHETTLKLDGRSDKSLSVIVTQASSPTSENIITDRLLTSRLLNQVREPSWYFNTSSDSSRIALDILMMTQKIKEFDWREVLGYSTPKPTSWPDFLEISGQVLDDRKNEVPGPGNLNFYVEAEDSSTMNFQIPVGIDGKFQFDSVLFAGQGKFFYAFADKNGRQRPVRITINENDPIRKLEALSFIPNRNRTYDNSTAPELLQRIAQVGHHEEEIRVLEKVTLNVKKKRPTEEVEERYTTGVFRLPAGKTLDNINDPVRDKTMNVVDYIRNRVNDVELTSRGFVNRKTLSMGSNTKWAVGVFLDEVPTELSILRSVSMGDVALVKFYDAGWVGVGSTYPGGALAIYTKKNSENAVKPEKLPHISVKGFNQSYPFLHIDYGKKDIRHAPVDHRYTLYWDPEIVLRAGTTTLDLRFFGNDLGKPKRIVVEGLDAEGRLVYGERIIEY